MKTLRLPEPAASLWRNTRDTLTNLGPPTRPWRIRMGGGTVLAGRWGHRTSTDIDVTLPDRQNLGELMSWAPDSLATRLNASPTGHDNPKRIVVKKELGLIDLNTAPIRPATGHEDVLIDGQRVTILSTTQILAGKLERNRTKNPIRDAIDIVEAEHRKEGRQAIAAASGQFIDEDLDRITENMSRVKPDDYEMMDKISIRPDLRRPPSELRSEAIESIANNQPRRMLFRVNGNALTVETHTIRGEIFVDRCKPNEVEETCTRLGLNNLLARSGARTEQVAEKARACIHNHLDGVVFDTDDPNPADRLNWKNPDLAKARSHPEPAPERPPTRAPRAGPSTERSR